MKQETGATFVGVHQSGREVIFDTDISPEALEEVMFQTLAIRPQCPIFKFKMSGKDYHMLINLNHFTYCEVNAKGERMTEGGLLLPGVRTIAQLQRPLRG